MTAPQQPPEGWYNASPPQQADSSPVSAPPAAAPDMSSDTNAEPITEIIPPETESAFVALPDDPELAEQRMRLAALMDRGVLVLAVISLITLAFAVVTTVSGAPTLLGWSFPFVFGAGALGLYYLLGRMEARPANSIEIPLDVADDLTEAISQREELDARGLDALDPEDHVEVIREVDERLRAAGTAAEEALAAQRSGDAQAAEEARVQLRMHIAEIGKIYHDTLDEWDEFADEFEDDYEDDTQDGYLAAEEDLPPESAERMHEARHSPHSDVEYVDDQPSIVRPENSRDENESGTSRRARRYQRPTDSSGRRTKRTKPYRPNSPDSE